MPNYPWLIATPLDTSDVADRMAALRVAGVPYSKGEAEYQQNVKNFGEDVAKTLKIEDAEENLRTQAASGNFDTNSGVTEMAAVVAYLQVLGTMVDFSKFDDDYFVKFR